MRVKERKPKVARPRGYRRLFLACGLLAFFVQIIIHVVAFRAGHRMRVDEGAITLAFMQFTVPAFALTGGAYLLYRAVAPRWGGRLMPHEGHVLSAWVGVLAALWGNGLLSSALTPAMLLGTRRALWNIAWWAFLIGWLFVLALRRLPED